MSVAIMLLALWFLQTLKFCLNVSHYYHKIPHPNKTVFLTSFYNCLICSLTMACPAEYRNGEYV